MRFVDILGLAFSALLQQKVRTTLTTLGVVFGTFILVASLSVRAGVNETIVEQYAKFAELRKIEVYPRYLDLEAQIPPEKLEVKGTMTEAKRQRIRQQIIRRWNITRATPAPPSRLTPEAIATLAALDHVRGVEPMLFSQGWATLGDKTEPVQSVAALPDNALIGNRLIAGATFAAADSRQLLVGEYLLYLFGITDDAEVEKVPGRKLRLEYRLQQPGTSSGLLVTLLTGGAAKVNRDEDTALDKILKQLPDALDKFNLTPAEQATLRNLLKNAAPSNPPAKPFVVVEDFTICGVVRAPDKSDVHRRWDWRFDQIDIVVPAKTAETMFFQFPANRDNGFDRVFVEVDALEHVKETAARIEEMGFTAHSMVQRLEMEQFTYNLIFSSMTVFAALGLLVAAFGITNTMLMSVLERVREIGVMKAVGARNGHIQAIFLLEGAWVGLVGGLLGLLLAWAASFPGDAWVRSAVSSNLSIQLETSIFRFPLWLQSAAPGFACLIATLGAYYPARQAARVNPIAALRHD